MRADARKNFDHVLATAREVIAEQGADASLRDIARRADVGLGTLYRHFPTREALLDALLRASFDDLTAKAATLEASSSPGDALVEWLRDATSYATEFSGVVTPLVAAMNDPASALHTSCVTMKAAGARLLARAQAHGVARTDIDGADLFALFAAFSWLEGQPAMADRADRLRSVVLSAILTDRALRDTYLDTES